MIFIYVAKNVFSNDCFPTILIMCYHECNGLYLLLT